MFQKKSILIVALLMVFSLTACNAKFDLADYKVTAKAELANYATEINYSADNWSIVLGIIDAGKTAVDAAENKTGVDTAVSTAKEEIRAVQTNNTFPSTLGNFDLEEFTDEFFENNTLILVPFEWPHLLYEHLDFYTAFTENGKLNFLIEVTDPNGGGDEALDMRLFAVVVPNAVFNSLALGETRVFETYDFSGTNPIENSRDLLSHAEGKSVEHRVSFVPSEAITHRIFEMTVISSRESLQEYFSI